MMKLYQANFENKIAVSAYAIEIPHNKNIEIDTDNGDQSEIKSITLYAHDQQDAIEIANKVFAHIYQFV